ncbi:MFS transporter [Nocardioides donggukensis]|uniref:MFS transporter n=1 Tax=Nocardioides donggukensis TaxID=2774019 RepID=UPI00191E5BC1|nr:MFS transporter [Nocardioides donggukensis]
MLSRLGFPSVGEHRRFVTAIGVDAIGSGVFMPVTLLYFLVATPMGLVEIGAAISIASLVSIPVGPLVGSVVDRVGSTRVLQVANLLQGAGFVAYLFVDGFTGVLVATVAVSAGRTAFWGSFGATVAIISPPGERELWFGFLGALRNVGFALGGLLAGLAITVGSPEAYAAVVVLNAVSYALAFWLMLSVPNRVPARLAPVEEPGSWLSVLRDGPYRILVLTQASFSLSMMALNFAMPVYITTTLGLPGWVAGALFTVNTVLVGFGQGLVVRSLTGTVRRQVLLWANVAFAASYLVLYGASAASLAVGVVVVLGAGAVYTLGELLGGPVLSALAAEAAPEHLRGRYLSYHQLAWTVTGAIAPVGFAWLLVQGPAATWLGLVGLTAVGAALTVRLGARMPLARARITNGAVGDPLPIADEAGL